MRLFDATTCHNQYLLVDSSFHAAGQLVQSDPDEAIWLFGIDLVVDRLTAPRRGCCP